MIKGVVKGKMTNAQRARYHQQTERIRYTAQKSMRANLRRIFKAQEAAILELPDPSMDQVRNILIQSVPALNRVFEATYVNVADAIYPLLDKDVKSYASYDVKAKKEDTAYEAAIREWIRNECGIKITYINETTLNQVRALFEASANQIEFREAIAPLFDNSITPFRSNAIARTETACATNRASVTTMESLGFDGRKTWLAVGDMDTRDTHMHMDNVTVDFDQDFEWDRPDGIHVRMECPLDHKWAPPASEVVNCRCDVGFEY
ncbi:MAG: hypothetical protein IKN41_05025 [Candidatus Methanomethylophilaceae archaeon]|nr:hypothetical protein [Candidatus Methanomethylophilaceae archaeon]